MRPMRRTPIVGIVAALALTLGACQSGDDDGGAETTGQSGGEESGEQESGEQTTDDDGERPMVVGHRGAMGTSPENTVASIQDAVDAGVDAIEIDVQLSQDDEPFLFHDDNGTRTTDVAEVFADRANSPITSFTWEELQQLDAGSFFDEEFAGEGIAHLDDVPEVIGDSGIIVNIELKEPQDSYGVEQVVADALTSEQWAPLVSDGQVIVSSFNDGTLAAFAELAPDVPVYPIGTIPSEGILDMWAGFSEGVVTNHSTVNASDIDRVRAADLRVGVYTVNYPDEMNAAIDLGVDFIITDYPRDLIEILDGQ